MNDQNELGQHITTISGTFKSIRSLVILLGFMLALSKKIVDAHGGTMEVASNVEAGTEFVLSFPKDAESAS